MRPNYIAAIVKDLDILSMIVVQNKNGISQEYHLAVEKGIKMKNAQRIKKPQVERLNN